MARRTLALNLIASTVREQLIVEKTCRSWRKYYMMKCWIFYRYQDRFLKGKEFDIPCRAEEWTAHQECHDERLRRPSLSHLKLPGDLELDDAILDQMHRQKDRPRAERSRGAAETSRSSIDVRIEIGSGAVSSIERTDGLSLGFRKVLSGEQCSIGWVQAVPSGETSFERSVFGFLFLCDQSLAMGSLTNSRMNYSKVPT